MSEKLGPISFVTPQDDDESEILDVTALGSRPRRAPRGREVLHRHRPAAQTAPLPDPERGSGSG